MMKRILALLLAMILALSLLTACGGEKTEAASVPASASEAAPEAASAPETPEAPVPEESVVEESVLEEPAEPQSSYVPVELPLTDEPVSMTYWMALKPFLMAYNCTAEDLRFYQVMEERTGVHLDLTAIMIFSASENFNLMMASGDYPDMIDSFQVFYTSSADSAIEQEIIIDLMDYMNIMPNFEAALDSNPSFWLDSMTQEGALPSANMLFSTKEGATIGPMIREDWLDKVGKDVPVTYDEMEDVLAAWKSELGVAGLGLGPYGQSWGLSAGLGVRDLDIDDASKAGFLNIDGKVSFSQASEGYRDYLEMLSDWYQKGYVWPDFISQANSIDDFFAAGAIGYSCNERDLVETLTERISSVEPGGSVIGMRAIRNDPDEILQISYFVENIIYGTAVSGDCKDLELAARWLDYCYSEDGQILTNYGVEGEGLQYDENGNPEYTDLVVHSDYYSAVAASSIFSMYGGAMLCNADRVLPSYSDRVRNAIEAWAYDGQEQMYPTKVTMTAEQGEEYSAIINDVNGYVAEMTLKFIVGEVPLNDEMWQEYLDVVDDMGLQDAIQIKQDALDVYLKNA